MSRLSGIRQAERPKMHGRALLSGPSGAGKTWTAHSMATHLALAEERPGSILTIDTERESALTYADVFGFEHLPWRPPYDPGELADVLGELGDRYAVVIVDSLSKFWRGKGGTLDIADGKFGGWKAARPVQDTLVEALLAVPAHLLLCVRSKMDYLAEGGFNGQKQTITKVGLAPIQDDELVYEVNIALDIDLEHRITVTKSRTVAVPVGRMYPAGMEKKAAEDYAEWLAGGVPPAARADVEEITDAFSQIVDAEVRKLVKHEYVERFGMPHSLTAAQVGDAKAWLTERLTASEGGASADRVVSAQGAESEGVAHAPVTGSAPAPSPSDDVPADYDGGDPASVEKVDALMARIAALPDEARASCIKKLETEAFDLDALTAFEAVQVGVHIEAFEPPDVVAKARAFAAKHSQFGGRQRADTDG